MSLEYEKEQDRWLQELNDNPVLLKQIADASPAIIYLIDLKKMEFIYLNKRVEEAWGYDELYIFTQGNNIFRELGHPDDVEKWIGQLTSISGSGDLKKCESEIRIDTRQQGYRWFRIRDHLFRFDDFGRPSIVIGVAFDIHTEKLTQLALEKNRIQLEHQNNELQNFKSIVESSHDAVMTLDLKDRIVQWNPAAEIMSGYSEKTIKGKSFIEQFIPLQIQKNFRQAIRKVKQGKSVIDHVAQLINAKNKKIDIEITIFPLKNEKGEVIYCCGLARNITNVLKAEKDIRLLNLKLIQNNKELNLLTNELRTFNKVATNQYLETLKTLYTSLEYIITIDGTHLSNTGKANIRRAQASIQKMKLLTHDIIAYLRLYDFGNIKPETELADILNLVILDLQGKFPEQRLRIQSDKMPRLRSNPMLIRLLFHNIIENAIKFGKSTEPPFIRINYSLADEINFCPDALQDTAYHIISFRDNGIGINPQFTSKVFQLFTKLDELNRHGSGVGLAVCKKIMELHGGFIDVESKPGEGSTFRCYFPVEEVG